MSDEGSHSLVVHSSLITHHSPLITHHSSLITHYFDCIIRRDSFTTSTIRKPPQQPPTSFEYKRRRSQNKTTGDSNDETSCTSAGASSLGRMRNVPDEFDVEPRGRRNDGEIAGNRLRSAFFADHPS